jgi:hypothetical protein
VAAKHLQGGLALPSRGRAIRDGGWIFVVVRSNDSLPGSPCTCRHCHRDTSHTSHQLQSNYTPIAQRSLFSCLFQLTNVKGYVCHPYLDKDEALTLAWHPLSRASTTRILKGYYIQTHKRTSTLASLFIHNLKAEPASDSPESQTQTKHVTVYPRLEGRACL